MIDKLIGPITGIVDKFVVDKDLKMQLQHELETAIHSANLAQLEVNKAEAGHKSIFVAGWRPSVGWVCSLAMLYHFILAPMIQFGFALGLQMFLWGAFAPWFGFITDKYGGHIEVFIGFIFYLAGVLLLVSDYNTGLYFVTCIGILIGVYICLYLYIYNYI